MGLGLNLSGADTSGGDFEPLPVGTYDARVESVEMQETKGDGKLPAGTPMLNVEFIITEDKEVTVNEKTFNAMGKHAWRYFVYAPEKIDGKKYEHKDKMDGILVRFLTAIGYDEKEVMSGDFNLDLQDMEGRECRIVLGIREYKPDPDTTIRQNDVKGVKPATAATGSLI